MVKFQSMFYLGHTVCAQMGGIVYKTANAVKVVGEMWRTGESPDYTN